MKDYEIKQDGDYSFRIKINSENSRPLYQSILKLCSVTIYDEETEALFITAETVETLKAYLFKNLQLKMSQSKCIKMIDELTKQMIYLKKQGYGFYGFDLNDIVLIDEDKFIICNSSFLLPIQDNQIWFYSPIKKPFFMDLEINKLTTLPSKIDYRCVYYSLGVLLVFCLLNNYLLVGNEQKSVEEVESILYPLKNTKIYWFLKRCLDSNIEKRVLLLI
jgi:hypothetical protein